MERSKEILASAAEAVPRWLREHRIEAAAMGIVGVSVATAYAVWRWQAGSKTKLRAKEGAAGRASARIGLNKYETAFAEDFLDRDELPEDCGFECIGGLEEQVSAIEELVLLPLSRSDLFQHSKIASRPSGVLLYGPPGTGKTMLAKAIARSAHASFLPLNIAHLQSKWFGETPKYIDGLWSLARRCAPCVIFIDEIDGFLGTRRDLDQQHVTSMKTKFMQEWDGMAKPGAAGEAWVLVVAATNKPWAVDPAVLRRMPRQICVGLPDAAGRASILRVMLRGERVEPGLDVAAVAELAEGYSGSDLKELVRTASLAPIREALAAERRAAAAARGAAAAGGGAATAGPAGAAAATAPAPPPRGMRLEDFLCALEAVRPNGDVARAYYYESLTAGQTWNGAGAGAGHGGRSSALSGGAGAMPAPPVGRAAAAAMAAGAASPQAAGGSPSSSSAAGGGVRETSKAVLMFGPSAKANSLRFAEAIEQEARAAALGSP